MSSRKKYTFIIAEVGVNHNGSLHLAKELIDAAKEIGADAVKFQTFKASQLANMNAPKAPYQLETTSPSESQFDMLKKLELSYEDHRILIEHCHKKDVMFLSSPFDLESIDLLLRLGLDIIKIPSGEITNLLYLEKIAMLNKKILLSTGMSTLDEIGKAIDILTQNSKKRDTITVLHCNTGYPTPMEDVNLSAMNTIREVFNVNVGYSDHTIGIEVPVAAVALGAQVIEKHFTLNRKMDGPDHASSSTPDEFKAMIKAIRNIEKALGNGTKAPSQSELQNIKSARKSIVASQFIEKGEIFTRKNIAVRRPGNGISPMKIYEVLGKKAKKNFKEGSLIEL